MTGAEYCERVAAYIVHNYGARGIAVYRELYLGKTVIGKNRRIDIFVVHEASAAVLAIECKYQDSPGTVDEKVPYALQDLEAMDVPAYIVYAGEGFSEGILHMLAAHPRAAHCRPADDHLQPVASTRELDVVLAMAFKWWDVIVAGKRPVALPGL